MVTKLDVARWLGSGTGGGTVSKYSRAGGVSGTPGAGTSMRYGYAMADSLDGWVTVKLDTSEESIACVCDSPIKQGQRVQVWSQNGQLKAQVIGQNIVDEAVDESTNQSVSSVTTEYAPGESADVAPIDGWSEAYPTTADYVWQRMKTTKGDGTVKYSTPACISKPPEGYGRDATYYATSSTGTTTAAKVATVQSGGSFSLKEGATVSVKFTYGNTASSPTLNVGGTGARPIYTLGTPYAYWAAGASVLFVYDGSAWQVASTPVYASTTTIGNPAAQNVYIDGQGVAMRNGTTDYGTYGPDEVHLGLNASQDTVIYLFNDTMRMRAVLDGTWHSSGAALAIEPVPGNSALGMALIMNATDFLKIYSDGSGAIGFSETVLSNSTMTTVRSTDGNVDVDAKAFVSISGDSGVNVDGSKMSVRSSSVIKPAATIGKGVNDPGQSLRGANSILLARRLFSGTSDPSFSTSIYQSGNYIYVDIDSPTNSGTLYVEASATLSAQGMTETNLALDVNCERVSGSGPAPSFDAIGGLTTGAPFATVSVSPVLYALPFSALITTRYRFWCEARTTNATGSVNTWRMTVKVI